MSAEESKWVGKVVGIEYILENTPRRATPPHTVAHLDSIPSRHAGPRPITFATAASLDSIAEATAPKVRGSVGG